jgi:hypothetical protein
MRSGGALLRWVGIDCVLDVCVCMYVQLAGWFYVGTRMKGE